MKKALAALLAAALSLSLAIPVFAEPAATLSLPCTEEAANCAGGKELNWYSSIISGVTWNMATENQSEVTFNIKYYPDYVLEKDESSESDWVKVSGLNGLDDGYATTPKGSVRDLGIRIPIPAGAKTVSATATESCSDKIYFGGSETPSQLVLAGGGETSNVEIKADTNGAEPKDIIQYVHFATKNEDESYTLDGITNNSSVTYTFTYDEGTPSTTYTLKVNAIYPEVETGDVLTPTVYGTLDYMKNSLDGEYVLNVKKDPMEDGRPNNGASYTSPILLKPSCTFVSTHKTGNTTGAEGYWVGAWIKLPDGVDQSDVKIYQSADPEQMGEPTTADSKFFKVDESGNQTSDGSGALTVDFYTTAVSIEDGSSFKPYTKIVFGSGITPVWYKWDVSGVTIKKEASDNIDIAPPGGTTNSGTIKLEVTPPTPDSATENKGETYTPDEITIGAVTGTTSDGAQIKVVATDTALAAAKNKTGADETAEAILDVNVTLKDSSGNPIDVSEDTPVTLSLIIPDLEQPEAGKTHKLFHYKANGTVELLAEGAGNKDDVGKFFYETNPDKKATVTFKMTSFSPVIITLGAPTPAPNPNPNPNPNPTPTPDPEPVPPPSTGNSGSYWDGSVLVDIDQGLYGTVTPGIGYYQGWTTFTVHPNDGYEADYVMIDGKKQVAVNNNQFSINVTEPIRVTVTYKAAEALDISVEAPSAPDTTAPTANPQTGDSWFAHLFDIFF